MYLGFGGRPRDLIKPPPVLKFYYLRGGLITSIYWVKGPVVLGGL